MFLLSKKKYVYIVPGYKRLSRKLREKFELGFSECNMHKKIIRPKINEVNSLGYYSTNNGQIMKSVSTRT